MNDLESVDGNVPTLHSTPYALSAGYERIKRLVTNFRGFSGLFQIYLAGAKRRIRVKEPKPNTRTRPGGGTWAENLMDYSAVSDK